MSRVQQILSLMPDASLAAGRHDGHEKAQAPGRTGGMRRISCLACYGPGLIGVQTGACIVRQAQDRTMPEYIRPGTVSSTLAVTPAAVEVHNNVRWVSLIWGLKSDPQGVRERTLQSLHLGAFLDSGAWEAEPRSRGR